MPISISLCMIIKNEEDVLARCLNSAAPIADEIIIVDTGSEDKTTEIALSYTDKVYHFKWCDDFAAARNFSFSKATMEYCMWLDADDVITEDNLKLFLKLKSDPEMQADVIMLPYCLTVNPDGSPDFWYYRERIVRNLPQYKWDGRVHEAITPSGKIVYGDAVVMHRKTHPSEPGRNLRILEKIKSDPGGLSPRQQFYYGRELFENNRFSEAADELELFIKSPGGWIENKINACMVLALCYEKTNNRIKAYSALLDSFRLDTPRAELCCQLGRLFMEDGLYNSAVYWYKTALDLPYNPGSGGFVLSECYGFLPCIQLCVCYDRLGDLESARVYNEKAGEYRPDSPEYLYNKAYFNNKSMKGEQNL